MDTLQDHIHAPNPYEDEEPPRNSARLQFKRDLAMLSLEEQSALLSPESDVMTGLQFMFDPTAQGVQAAAPPPDEAVQFSDKGGNPLQQPIDASPFKFLGVILMAVNPETLGDYQRDVEAWVSMAGIPGSKPGAAAKALAEILKKVNPATVGNYGPLVDAWAAQATGSDLSGTFPILAEGLKAISPEMMPLYGPLVDLWAMGVPIDAAAAAAAAPEPMDFGGEQLGLEHIQSGSPSFLLALGSMLKAMIPDAANEVEQWMVSEPELAGLAPILQAQAPPEAAELIGAWEGAGATPDATAALLSQLFPSAAASVGAWSQMVILSTAVGGPDALAPVQAKGGTRGEAESIHRSAAEGVRGSGGTLPHYERIQSSFGDVDVSNVRAFVGGSATRANQSMGSLAYATGSKVAFKSSPDLHTAAHEAAHIVQQRRGVNLQQGIGQVGDKYEKHADAVAARVVSGRSAADLLGGSSGNSSAVQHAIDPEAEDVQHKKKKPNVKSQSQRRSDKKAKRDAKKSGAKTDTRVTFVPQNLGALGSTLTVEEAGGKAALKMNGSDAPTTLDKYGDASSPIGKAKNGAALEALQTAVAAVEAEANKVKVIKISGGKIEPADNRTVKASIKAAAKAIKAFGKTLEIPLLARALQVEPFTPAYAVELEVGWNDRWPQDQFVQEMTRQVTTQKQEMNKLSVDQWVQNRNVFKQLPDKFDELHTSHKKAVLEELHKRAQDRADTSRSDEKKQKCLDVCATIQTAMNSPQPTLPGGDAKKEVTGGREHRWTQQLGVDEQVLAHCCHDHDQLNTILAMQPQPGPLRPPREQTSPEVGSQVEAGSESRFRSQAQHRPAMEKLLALLTESGGKWEGLASQISEIVVLHNPDQVAGGFGWLPPLDSVPEPTDLNDWAEYDRYLRQLLKYIGPSCVNSAIGIAWTNAIMNAMDAHAQSLKQVRWPILRMNVDLTAKLK